MDTFLNKKNEILELIDNDKPDVLVFTELLNKKYPSITSSELKIKGYQHVYDEEKIEDKANKRRGLLLLLLPCQRQTQH